MFEQKGLIEIIEADPSSLSPVEANSDESSEPTLTIFDDKEVLSHMLNTLIAAKPKNFDSLPYQDRLKQQSIKSQLIKIFEF